MKRVILKGRADGISDVNLIMHRFLFQYRNTPYTTTGTPAKLLLGRNLHSKFDLMLPATKEIVHDNQNKQKPFYKTKTNRSFQINDEVWVRDYRNDRPDWCPAKVTNVLGQRTYTVSITSGITWNRHANQIRMRRIPDVSVTSIIPISKIIQEVGINDNGSDENSTTNISETSLRRRSQIKIHDRYQAG